VHLFAALLPPPDELERVRAVAAGVAPVRDRPVTTGPPGRHRVGRRQQPEAPPPLEPMLDLIPTESMHLPVVRFGNLGLDVATRLADAIERDARAWESPRLQLAGGLALEPEGDNSVWVKLAGDLDALRSINQGLARVAQVLHLFVDRRVFRPHVRLGTVNEHTTTGYLEQLLSVLDELDGSKWWQTDLALLIPADRGPGLPPYKHFKTISLGSAVPH
jgi:2'-5' RNA ligase